MGRAKSIPFSYLPNHFEPSWVWIESQQQSIRLLELLECPILLPVHHPPQMAIEYLCSNAIAMCLGPPWDTIGGCVSSEEEEDNPPSCPTWQTLPVRLGSQPLQRDPEPAPILPFKSAGPRGLETPAWACPQQPDPPWYSEIEVKS